MKPTVLLVTTSRWFPTARLAVALANAGAAVEAVCPPGHPIEKTTAVGRTFPYRALAPLQSIVRAMQATNPALLISGDDLATTHLHALYRQNSQAGKSGEAICAIVERSLGAPQNFPIIDDRASFMRIAEQAGVRVPRTECIDGVDDLETWATQTGFPAVLKANGTSGGVGVRVVHDLVEARRALRLLGAPPLLARALKRTLLDRDATLLAASLLRHRSAVTAQAFVPGTESTSAVACWKGEVLASLHFEVLQKTASAGHATVLRRSAHPEMAATAEAVVRRLQLSGLHGFDFMLEKNTGAAYLLEINPRATQVCHLSFGAGRDLPAALVAAVLGVEASPAPTVTENDVIALFPQELRRDAHSEYIRLGYHDLPYGQDALLQVCLRKTEGLSAAMPAEISKRN